MSGLGAIFGTTVIVNEMLWARRVQCRFPRSKRKRIRRKWAAQAGNFKTIQDCGAYEMNVPGMGRSIICSPPYLEKLKAAFKGQGVGDG